MKTITKYLSDDGTEFDTPDAANKSDEITRAVKDAMRFLPKHDDSGFDGYYQLEKAAVSKARKRLLEIAATVIDHHWITQCMEDESKHISWAQRVIGEYSYRSLDRALTRIASVDAQSREWSQPYYAANPGEGVQVRLNPAA